MVWRFVYDTPVLQSDLFLIHKINSTSSTDVKQWNVRCLLLSSGYSSGRISVVKFGCLHKANLNLFLKVDKCCLKYLKCLIYHKYTPNLCLWPAYVFLLYLHCHVPIYMWLFLPPPPPPFFFFLKQKKKKKKKIKKFKLKKIINNFF